MNSKLFNFFEGFVYKKHPCLKLTTNSILQTILSPIIKKVGKYPWNNRQWLIDINLRAQIKKQQCKPR